LNQALHGLRDEEDRFRRMGIEHYRRRGLTRQEAFERVQAEINRIHGRAGVPPPAVVPY
jgi:hypothetical protein